MPWIVRESPQLNSVSKAISWATGAVLTGVVILMWWGAQPAKRPTSMPVDSVWIDAPALPFSWHHGWWFGCWIGSDGYSNQYRLWAAGSDNLVYEGKYTSCDTNAPVLGKELKIKAPVESMHMWVGINQSGDIAPAAFLRNGEFLVPVRAPHGCEDLKRNLAFEH